ncbi:MAG: hypothetical protein GKS01_08310 [Alphaproteobacteria bacterium]|nr:hypothetical protein [Alphaproteobacteria bacterium]
MPGILFGTVVIWAIIQGSVITPVNWHDPVWQEAAKALGRSLQGSIAADPGISIEHAARLMAYAGIFWLAAQYGRDPQYARKIIWCIVIAGICYAAYGLSVYTGGNKTILGSVKWANRDDLTSTFVGRAAYGAYAGVVLLAMLALILHTASQTVRAAAKRDKR